MDDQKHILIEFAHPAVHKSRNNRELLQAVSNLENVKINKLYDRYPDFFIDVKQEQQLLSESDIIILQFPFYWYSSPSLLKEWTDLVLEHNWAYGKNGNMLKGKYLGVAITTGGGQQAYSQNGYNQYNITDFLIPYKRTAAICKMHWLPPFVVHGTHLLNNESLKECSVTYKSLLIALRNDTFSQEDLTEKMYLNDLIK